ncbi:MAG TPA: DUF4389 domain-containing protein [Symbiobacteriaceae bacterium]|nr:DUF4389 domain-containing protein [Symbiobacteriaceae bacterium]
MSTPEQQQAYAQGYHVGYQHGMQAAQGQPGANPNYPVDLVLKYPERSSRLLMFFMFFKPFLLIPHLFVLWFLGLAAGFVMIIAWFAVVFTGNYPRGLWDFMTGILRWQTRVSCYMAGLTDEYPPFTMN